MVALIVGIVFVAFAIYSVLPIQGWGLQWWDEVIFVLKGAIPLIAVFVGLIAVFIGIADIKDRIEAKKEEAEESEQASSENAASSDASEEKTDE